MDINVKDVYEGWRNLFKSLILKKETDELVIKKMNICASCDLLTKKLFCNKNKKGEVIRDFQYGKQFRKKGELYNGCGCYIPAKARSKSTCPLGKWIFD